jgi:hypothetical protein
MVEQTCADCSVDPLGVDVVSFVQTTVNVLGERNQAERNMNMWHASFLEFYYSLNVTVVLSKEDTRPNIFLEL